jgi:hypothetical protein
MRGPGLAKSSVSTSTLTVTSTSLWSRVIATSEVPTVIVIKEEAPCLCRHYRNAVCRDCFTVSRSVETRDDPFSGQAFSCWLQARLLTPWRFVDSSGHVVTLTNDRARFEMREMLRKKVLTRGRVMTHAQRLEFDSRRSLGIFFFSSLDSWSLLKLICPPFQEYWCQSRSENREFIIIKCRRREEFYFHAACIYGVERGTTITLYVMPSLLNTIYEMNA